MNSDLHRVGGVLAVCFPGLIALTGVTMVWGPQVTDWVYRTTNTPERARVVSRPQPGTPPLPLSELTARANAALPGAETIRITLAIQPDSPVVIRKKFPQELHPNRMSSVYLDPYSGEVLRVENALQASAGSRLLNLRYPLHIGQYGGSVVRVVYVLVGLTPAFLFVTGCLMSGNRYWTPGAGALHPGRTDPPRPTNRPPAEAYNASSNTRDRVSRNGVARLRTRADGPLFGTSSAPAPDPCCPRKDATVRTKCNSIALSCGGGAELFRDRAQACFAKLGLRASRGRMAVVDALDHASQPLSPYELADALRLAARSVHVKNVYRTLALLEEQGLVHRVLPSGKLAACRLGSPHGPHVHMVCQGCGRLEEIAAPALADVAREAGSGSGFHVERAYATLFGLCPECAAGRTVQCVASGNRVTSRDPTDTVLHSR